MIRGATMAFVADCALSSTFHRESSDCSIAIVQPR